MPLSETPFPFPIDEKSMPIFSGKSHEHWYEKAQKHGFKLIGRAVDRLHVVLGCKLCGGVTLKRINVVLSHSPECPHCIRKRREAASAKVGARA